MSIRSFLRIIGHLMSEIKSQANLNSTEIYKHLFKHPNYVAALLKKQPQQ